MDFKSGDRVVAEAESTERAPREGTVEEKIVERSTVRYRIRWDDGHESIYTPAAGALQRLHEEERASSGKPAS